MSAIMTAAKWGGTLLVVGVFVGCAPTPSSAPDASVDRTETDTRFDENKPLFAAVKNADRLTLYEGLPHQMFERDQLEKEKQAKPTVQMHGYPFYRETLDVVAEDQEVLKKLLADAGSFRQWEGEKKCGGFHPDYLVELRAGEKVYRFLICFGCCEVKVFGPGNSLRADMVGQAGTQLTELLKKYQKNRPARREDG